MGPKRTYLRQRMGNIDIFCLITSSFVILYEAARIGLSCLGPQSMELLRVEWKKNKHGGALMTSIQGSHDFDRNTNKNRKANVQVTG